MEESLADDPKIGFAGAAAGGCAVGGLNMDESLAEDPNIGFVGPCLGSVGGLLNMDSFPDGKDDPKTDFGGSAFFDAATPAAEKDAGNTDLGSSFGFGAAVHAKGLISPKMGFANASLFSGTGESKTPKIADAVLLAPWDSLVRSVDCVEPSHAGF
jgi:hypothetical protein